MKVVVGSVNVPKRRAVAAVFARAFAGTQVVVECVEADSGVSAHPLSVEETLQGAHNRAVYVQERVPGADYYVGVEGGLLTAADRTWEIGMVVVVDANGTVATGTSAGIEVRGAILQALRDGAELSGVMQDRFGIESLGQANGFYGLATNDLVTRQAAYEQAITFALAPFLHPELYAA